MLKSINKDLLNMYQVKTQNPSIPGSNKIRKKNYDKFYEVKKLFLFYVQFDCHYDKPRTFPLQSDFRGPKMTVEIHVLFMASNKSHILAHNTNIGCT